MPFRPQARISLSASPDISALGRGYLRPQAGISARLRAGRHFFFCMQGVIPPEAGRPGDTRA